MRARTGPAAEQIDELARRVTAPKRPCENNRSATCAAVAVIQRCRRPSKARGARSRTSSAAPSASSQSSSTPSTRTCPALRTTAFLPPVCSGVHAPGRDAASVAPPLCALAQTSATPPLPPATHTHPDCSLRAHTPCSRRAALSRRPAPTAAPTDPAACVASAASHPPCARACRTRGAAGRRARPRACPSAATRAPGGASGPGWRRPARRRHRWQRSVTRAQALIGARQPSRPSPHPTPLHPSAHHRFPLPSRLSGKERSARVGQRGAQQPRLLQLLRAPAPRVEVLAGSSAGDRAAGSSAGG